VKKSLPAERRDSLTIGAAQTAWAAPVSRGVGTHTTFPPPATARNPEGDAHRSVKFADAFCELLRGHGGLVVHPAETSFHSTALAGRSSIDRLCLHSSESSLRVYVFSSRLLHNWLAEHVRADGQQIAHRPDGRSDSHFRKLAPLTWRLVVVFLVIVENTSHGEPRQGSGFLVTLESLLTLILIIMYQS